MNPRSGTMSVSRGSVTLWSFSLDVSTGDTRRLSRVLAPDELADASRFRRSRDRARYIVGRARMRQVLGELMGEPAPVVELRRNDFGKPELPDESRLWFNLAHADGTAVLAAATSGPVGVDIELLHPVPDRDLIAASFFAPQECAELERVPPAERDAAFLRCWTRKEAYVKAVGGGLALGLSDFAVSLLPEEPAIVWAADPAVPDQWSVTDLSVHVPGHLAALVVAGPRPGVRRRPLPIETENV